jgi:hypothetical protein
VSHAQFSGTITGEVDDPKGSVVPGAKLTLTKTDTGDVRTTTSNSSGIYLFVSLSPGRYRLDTAASGFATTENSFVLETGQTLNLAVKLAVGSNTQQIEVTTEAPVLDTADTRLQETLSTHTLSTLPLAGRNMISLVTLAPGVTGLGVTSNGSPGSGRDNYSTETQVDASANGQGAVGNMYVVDGLDVTSSIRAGVLNMTPNPDSIEETSIQTNTYNADYGRASSIQMTMTTESGTASITAMQVTISPTRNGLRELSSRKSTHPFTAITSRRRSVAPWFRVKTGASSSLPLSRCVLRLPTPAT